MSNAASTPSSMAGPTSRTEGSTPAAAASEHRQSLLGAIEAHALKLCVLGCPPLDMDRSLDILCEAGLIDEGARVTDSGRLAWDEYAQALTDEAYRRNIIPDISADEMLALGRLNDGQPLTDHDRFCLRRSRMAALVSGKPGQLEITKMGRRCYWLAAART